jgi:hypothetical protein
VARNAISTSAVSRSAGVLAPVTWRPRSAALPSTTIRSPSSEIARSSARSSRSPSTRNRSAPRAIEAQERPRRSGIEDRVASDLAGAPRVLDAAACVERDHDLGGGVGRLGARDRDRQRRDREPRRVARHARHALADRRGRTAAAE